ncbi:MAG: glycoside hydrolase family 31 protein [Marinifilaceae bacterium]
MKKTLILSFMFVLGVLGTTAQIKQQTEIKPLSGERWWGGYVALGNSMPYGNDVSLKDMTRNNMNNQVVPLLLSSHGRYVWSENPFQFEIKNGVLYVQSQYENLQPIVAGKTLKDAFMAAQKTHFPATNTIPEADFFSLPQYNTWIELMYDQNQRDIMNYAHKIVENGFPTGVFMVDDNWQNYYGNFDFKLDKFPDAQGMCDSLHAMGFKVMLWVAPYVSPDSPEFRELQGRGFLVRDRRTKQPAIFNWWNGYSACYDMTNPAAVQYLTKQLQETQRKYGIDGFKFDGGDIAYMQGDYLFHDTTANANVYMEKWAEIGLSFPYNELRACWKQGGQPLVQRLGDKNYSWHANSLLIPDMTAAGLLGYYYTCPDMIGGGQFTAFLNVKQFDEELIVRSCQVHALMPMMQFSVAPWRILSPENVAICAKYANLHKDMGPYILQLAHKASKTGEPIVQSMEYAFPHQGFIECKDQFMLGDKYLVAPMITKGTTRLVKLPKGRWKDDLGTVHRGPKEITVQVPLDRLPYYEKVK